MVRLLGFPAKSCLTTLRAPSALASVWSLLHGAVFHAAHLPAWWHAGSVPVLVQYHPSGVRQTEAEGVTLDKGTHFSEPQCPLHKTGIIAPTYRDICESSEKNISDASEAHTRWPRGILQSQSLGGVGIGGPQKGGNGSKIQA